MPRRQDLGEICPNYIYDYIGYIIPKSYLRGMILGLLESLQKYLWLDAALGAQPCVRHVSLINSHIIGFLFTGKCCAQG
jgi:hypothetical protein